MAVIEIVDLVCFVTTVIILKLILVLKHYINYHFFNGPEVRTGGYYTWSVGEINGGIFVDYGANNVHELVGSPSIIEHIVYCLS